MSTSLQNWNFSGQKLAQDTKGADFVTSESTLLHISRVLFDGESLMSVLAPHFEGAAAYPQGDKPGYDKFLMNIGSSLFNKPIGLFAIFRDMEDQSVGGVFFERTFVMSHNMQISSKSPFVGEGVQLMFDQLHPVQTAIG